MALQSINNFIERKMWGNSSNIMFILSVIYLIYALLKRYYVKTNILCFVRTLNTFQRITIYTDIYGSWIYIYSVNIFIIGLFFAIHLLHRPTCSWIIIFNIYIYFQNTDRIRIQEEAYDFKRRDRKISEKEE